MARLPIDRKRLASFCKTHGIRQLAIFGSAIHDDLTPESDIDVLVEFKPGASRGFSASFVWRENFLPSLTGEELTSALLRT